MRLQLSVGFTWIVRDGLVMEVPRATLALLVIGIVVNLGSFHTMVTQRYLGGVT